MLLLLPWQCWLQGVEGRRTSSCHSAWLSSLLKALSPASLPPLTTSFLSPVENLTPKTPQGEHLTSSQLEPSNLGPSQSMGGVNKSFTLLPSEATPQKRRHSFPLDLQALRLLG